MGIHRSFSVIVQGRVVLERLYVDDLSMKRPVRSFDPISLDCQNKSTLCLLVGTNIGSTP